MASENFKQTGKIKFSDINNLDNDSITTKSLTVNGDINCTGGYKNVLKYKTIFLDHFIIGETRTIENIENFSFLYFFFGGYRLPQLLLPTYILQGANTTYENTILSQAPAYLANYYVSFVFPSVTQIKFLNGYLGGQEGLAMRIEGIYF